MDLLNRQVEGLESRLTNIEKMLQTLLSSKINAPTTTGTGGNLQASRGLPSSVPVPRGNPVPQVALVDNGGYDQGYGGNDQGEGDEAEAEGDDDEDKGGDGDGDGDDDGGDGDEPQGGYGGYDDY